MTAFLRALVVLAAAGTISFPTQPPAKITTPDTAAPTSARKRSVGTPSTPLASRPGFVATDLEYYLTDDGIAYIRPGNKITIKSVTIPADRKPVVEFTITDNFDQPLDRLGKTTPGAVSTSWLLAWYNPDTRLYTSYLTRESTAVAGSPKAGAKASQATSESTAANYTDKGNGLYSYKFTAALPAAFDATKTHTLGVYSSRNLTEQIGKNYYANAEYDFRPDGQTVVAKWDKIREVASCHNCHDSQTFGLHGGSRRDVKLCVLCHNPGTTDPETGNSLDMATMTHKVHGAALLSTPYIIWGFQSAIHDYSEVTYPQDIRNCDNCHEGTTPTVAASVPTQKEVWYTQPSRRACGACHDSINWVTGENHPAGPQTSDENCATCHTPDSGHEFDASIKGGHTIPTKSTQLVGVKATIVSVSNVKAGEKPTIVYKFTNNKGEVLDGTKFSTFAPMHAGPTSSYTTYNRESVTATSTNKPTFDAATGNTTYTFTNPIPASATGTWFFTGDFYITSTLKRADGKADITGVRDAAINPQKYVALTGALTPRRTSVSIALCNECHDSLALHGGQRRAIEECVVCHNPTMTDGSRRPAAQGAAESISFQRMIHRIHTGVELTQEYTVWASSAHPYNEVTYPGDRRNCASCHVGDGQQVPAAGDAVVTPRDYFSPQGSGTTACLGCHDGRDAAAHAFLNTTQFGGQPAEACGVCHGKTADWSVDKSHAR